MSDSWGSDVMQRIPHAGAAFSESPADRADDELLASLQVALARADQLRLGIIAAHINQALELARGR